MGQATAFQPQMGQSDSDRDVLLIALADAFGFVGIIVAPPLSIVCQILWSRLVSHRACFRGCGSGFGP